MVVSGDQFKDFVYRVDTNEHGTTAAAARRRYSSVTGEGFYEPVGSVSISHTNNDLNNADQQEINGVRPAPPHRERLSHGILEDRNGSGQLRWVGGNMRPADVSAVSWLGMSREKGSKRALMNMVAAAVDAHGYMPHADSSLSYDGARMSRGAMRKYGMKAHPENQRATGGFSYDHEADSQAEYEAEDAWTGVLRNAPQYEHDEVDEIRKRVADQYRVQPELSEEEEKDRARRPGKGQLQLFPTPAGKFKRRPPAEA